MSKGSSWICWVLVINHWFWMIEFVINSVFICVFIKQDFSWISCIFWVLRLNCYFWEYDLFIIAVWFCILIRQHAHWIWWFVQYSIAFGEQFCIINCLCKFIILHASWLYWLFLINHCFGRLILYYSLLRLYCHNWRFLDSPKSAEILWSIIALYIIMFASGFL
jgi:hypothetical protein